uniref:WWE domain-containing protein n=1 Tax=Macrostomum lignano TaxID=282301 RepID=A0A1I8I5D1_9PLAT
ADDWQVSIFQKDSLLELFEKPAAIRADDGSVCATSAVRGYLLFSVTAHRLCRMPIEVEAAPRRHHRVQADHCAQVAEAHAASFDAESGDCALLQCDRGGRDACRKCRHEKDASLPMLWIKDPSETCWRTFQQSRRLRQLQPELVGVRERIRSGRESQLLDGTGAAPPAHRHWSVESPLGVQRL